jgi:ribosomal protein L11 methyltransferase
LSARWQVLTARVPDALDDEIAAVLGAGSLGVEVAACGPGVCEVRVYFDPADDPSAWRERAGRVLVAHGLRGGAEEIAIAPVEDGRWVERWQASLAPIELGRRFVVLPNPAADGPAGREAIRLVPGMAFGTGEHATTRLCAAEIERRVAPGSRWLDLGTGTGILAVVAARCGASRVFAVDHERDAVAVATEVVGANAVQGTVEVRHGSIGDCAGETFDGIVANVQSSFFLANARAVGDALAAGGVLVVSGILDDDVPAVSQALGAAGLRVIAQAAAAPWACLVLTRGDR